MDSSVGAYGGQVRSKKPLRNHHGRATYLFYGFFVKLFLVILRLCSVHWHEDIDFAAYGGSEHRSSGAQDEKHRVSFISKLQCFLPFYILIPALKKAGKATESIFFLFAPLIFCYHLVLGVFNGIARWITDMHRLCPPEWPLYNVTETVDKDFENIAPLQATAWLLISLALIWVPIAYHILDNFAPGINTFLKGFRWSRFRESYNKLTSSKIPLALSFFFPWGLFASHSRMPQSTSYSNPSYETSGSQQTPSATKVTYSAEEKLKARVNANKWAAQARAQREADQGAKKRKKGKKGKGKKQTNEQPEQPLIPGP